LKYSPLGIITTGVLHLKKITITSPGLVRASRKPKILSGAPHIPFVSQHESPFLRSAVKARVNFSEMILKRVKWYLITEEVVEAFIA
jgi:hypothetical protein